MAMEMVWNRSLIEIQKPVAHSIKLISKVGGNHGYILHLERIELLVVTERPCVHDDRAVTLVAEKYFELILWEECNHKGALVFCVVIKPLSLS